MRIPNNPSVLAQVKVMLHKMPLGTSLTLHDVMRAFPDQDETTLSAALSTLANNRFMEVEESKVFSVFVGKDGRQRASNLKSYKLIEYPEGELHTKPAVFNRAKNGVPTPVISAKEVPLKAGEKYDKAYALNPNLKWDPEPLFKMANDVTYVCDFPVRDEMAGDRSRTVYEWTIGNRLKNFNPIRDILVIYGDPMILAMAVFYLAMKQVKRLKIARFSLRTNSYEIREIAIADFAI